MLGSLFFNRICEAVATRLQQRGIAQHAAASFGSFFRVVAFHYVLLLLLNQMFILARLLLQNISSSL
jgi:hypothetical protein